MRILQAHHTVSAEVLAQTNDTNRSVVALIEDRLREGLRDAAKGMLPVLIEHDQPSHLATPGRKKPTRITGRAFVPDEETINLLHEVAATAGPDLLEVAQRLRKHLREAGGAEG